MKKALAGVLAVALAGVIAVSANAQVPNVQVYFDPYYNHTQSDCMPPNTPATLYVVANNFNMFVLGVDFMIHYPTVLSWLGDVLPVPFPGSTSLGNSPTGIGVTWALPQNGFNPLLVLAPTVLWLGCDCMQAPPGGYQILVDGYAPLGKPDPTGVRWPDYQEVPAVGMDARICPGVIATESTTWGGVKALYR
jgi:hypothetical protein